MFLGKSPKIKRVNYITFYTLKLVFYWLNFVLFFVHLMMVVLLACDYLVYYFFLWGTTLVRLLSILGIFIIHSWYF